MELHVWLASNSYLTLLEPVLELSVAAFGILQMPAIGFKELDYVSDPQAISSASRSYAG